MKFAVFLFLGLTFTSAQAEGKRYTLDLSKTSKAVKSGASGRFHLKIAAGEGFKVSPEAPLKIGLAGDELKLAKRSLRHEDAKDPTSGSPEFEVAFKAQAAGTHALVVDVSFFVCDDKLCERQSEKVTVPIEVKP